MSACSLTGLVEVRFPLYGIRLRPAKLDYKSNIGELDYATVELTVEAGELLDEAIELAVHPQPAEIVVGDTVLARLVIDNESLILGRDSATARLKDVRTVLTRGVVSGDFPIITLGEAVDYVLQQAVDPHGCIPGVQYTDETLAGAVEERYTTTVGKVAKAAGTLQDTIYEYVPQARIINELLNGTPFEALTGDELAEKAHNVGSMVGLPGEVGGFVFEEVSPAQALRQIEEVFSLTSVIEPDGTLTVGHPEAKGKLVPASPHPNSLRVLSYDVTEGTVPVSTVIVDGTYRLLWTGEDGNRGGAIGMVKGRAEASWTEEGDGRVVEVNAERVDNQITLARIADRELRRHIHDFEGGSVTVNPLSSMAAEVSPFDVQVGDHLFTFGIKRRCSTEESEEIPSEIFSINGVHHKFDPRDGWSLILHVGKLVPEESVSVSSFIYSPADDEFIDAAEYYKKYPNLANDG
ncbi:hypothetical protein DU504_11920 [Haloplanus salinus]|uniref:Uncharacterized protein n=1 Tax=Haloplanus salinus TaxID=1126245 RepID=A0A368NF30_9EURY|nr:hypothetical protein [Haloplanus salinus]RCU47939.1 hypothetical protein DU504_11920 [Haloplanus salinus]